MIRNLCAFNLSVVIINYKFNNLINLDENTGSMSGKLADSLYYLLGKEKKCRLIGVGSIGERLKNKSITGGFKILNDKKGDLILLSQPYYYISDIIDFSSPVISERYVVTHQIENSSSADPDQDLFNVVTLDYKYFISYVCLNMFVYAFIFVQVKCILEYDSKLFKLFECLRVTLKLVAKSTNDGFRNSKLFRIRFFGLIVFTIYILTFFTEIFISSSIKTSKIIIDTDKLIHNSELLFSSEKYICWIRSEPSLTLAEHSPKDTLLEKILRFKNKNDCFFEQNDVSFETIQKFQNSGFILSAYFFAIVLISSLINIERKFYWISESFYELILSYPVRKSLEIDQKRLLNEM